MSEHNTLPALAHEVKRDHGLKCFMCHLDGSHNIQSDGELEYHHWQGAKHTPGLVRLMTQCLPGRSSYARNTTRWIYGGGILRMGS
jgi:hypothetical protein